MLLYLKLNIFVNRNVICYNLGIFVRIFLDYKKGKKMRIFS